MEGNCCPQWWKSPVVLWLNSPANRSLNTYALSNLRNIIHNKENKK